MMCKAEGGKGREDQGCADMSVSHTYKDLPGFPSLQGVLGDVFSEATFISGGLWGSIKNQVIVHIFFYLTFLFLL